MPKVEFIVKVPVTVKKKADIYVSCCPVLDLYSQGRTELEARKHITEAIKLFITSCFERGTLDIVMKQCGFKLIRTAGASRPLPKDHKFVSVPIPFSAAGHCSTACAPDSCPLESSGMHICK